MRLFIKRWCRRLLQWSISVVLFLSLAYFFRKQLYPFVLQGLYKDTVARVQPHNIPANALLLDTRSKAEFQVSHLPQARWVGFENFDTARLNDVPKEQPLVLYCSIGYRSERIGERLQAAGYQKVYNLYGGIFEWMHQGQQVVDSEGKVTQKLHGYSPTWGIWAREGEVVYEGDVEAE